MRRLTIAGALVALAFAGGVVAQQLASRTLTGNEVIVAALGGPGGSSQFVPVAQLRNAQGVATTALTTGTLVTTTLTATLVSTAASVSLTVDLPPLPYDGEVFEWVNGASGAFTAGTIAQTDGSTIQGSTAASTLAAGGSIEFRYVLATNTWYRMR